MQNLEASQVQQISVENFEASLMVHVYHPLSMAHNPLTTHNTGPMGVPTQNSIDNHFRCLLLGWTPHIFTPQETHTARLEGLQYMLVAQQIREAYKDISPQNLPAEVQTQLIFAERSYKIRYFRTFPINNLPTEIITDILCFVVWASIHHPIDTRLHITWTCRQWRQIALADLTLWNDIWFHGSDAWGHESWPWAWFNQAHQAPLDIHIDTTRDHSNSVNNLTDDINSVTKFSGNDNTLHLLLRVLHKLPTIRILIIDVDDWKSLIQVFSVLGIPGSGGFQV
ncbi:hypothetical protein B0H17DRAFT_1129468 [Mycena rosella]|uniref:F-box domain-containing protein n=1 Tax=Mycena rosella TaxID=1033263 RepID=A0AAD7DV15_MYCRO|nr:hypothetical protein B0H17DRAFT_1129468 [Mycena rosella]